MNQFNLCIQLQYSCIAYYQFLNMILFSKLAILLWLYIYQAAPTQRARFPKIVGGPSANTYINVMDHNGATGIEQLVVAGDTKDPTIRGGFSTAAVGTAMIINYAATCMGMIWGKALTFGIFYFVNVRFNPMGTHIISLANEDNEVSAMVLIFNSTTGDLLDSIAYSDSAYSGAVHQWSRNLLLSSDASRAIVLNSLSVGADIGLQLLIYSPGQSTLSFAYSVTGLSSAYTLPYALMWYPYNEDKFFAFFNYEGTCIISLMDATSGRHVLSQSYSCTTVIEHDFMVSSVESDQYIVAVGATLGASNTRTYSILTYDVIGGLWSQFQTLDEAGSATAGISLSMANQLRPRGIHIATSQRFYVLVFGYLYIDNVAGIVMVDISNNIISFYYGPPPVPAGVWATSGILLSPTKYYYATHGTTMYTDSTTINSVGTYIQSLIHTSEQLYTCFYFTWTVSNDVDITDLTGTVSMSSGQFLSNPLYPTFQTGVIVAGDFIDLSPNQFTDIHCPAADATYTEQDEYRFLAVTQTVTSFNAMSYVASPSSYSIVPYESARICGAGGLTIAYSGTTNTGGILPGWVGVEPSTGAISVTDQVPPNPGYFIKVVGRISDIHNTATNSLFRLVISTNLRPYLITQLQSEYIVEPRSIYTIVLDPTDPEGDTITVTFQEQGSTPALLPPFITYDFPSKTITFSPTLLTPLYTTHLEILLQTAYHLVTIHFDLTIAYPPIVAIINPYIQNCVNTLMNLDAPSFIDEALPLIRIQAFTPLNYSLPSIQDPDLNETWSIHMAFGEASIFAKRINDTICFSAFPQHVRPTSYPIKIVLTDENPYMQKSRDYFLFVKVDEGYNMSEQNETGNSTENGEYEEIIKALNKAILEGANVQNSQGSLRIMKVNQFGQIKIQIQGGFLVDSMILKVSEEDLQVTLPTKVNKNVPFKIGERDINAGTLLLEVEFDDPEKISSDSYELDQILIKPRKELIVTRGLQIGRELNAGQQSQIQVLTLSPVTIQRRTLPPQLSKRNQRIAHQIQDASVYASYAFMSSTLLMNIFVSVFMNIIWDLLNDLSFLMILANISMSVPGLTQFIQSIFLSFIYMDLLQTDYWLPPLIFNGAEDYQTPLNVYFDMNGFSSTQSVTNLGSTFIFLCLFVALHGILLSLKIFKSILGKSWLDQPIKWLGSKIVWSGTVRFILQQFNPLATACLINLYDIKYNSPGCLGSTAISLMLTFALPLSLILIWKVLRQGISANNLNKKEFHETYGGIVEDLTTKSKISSYWNLLVLLRWSMTVFIIVVMRDSSLYQILSLLVINLLYTSLLVYARPFSESCKNTVAILNEGLISIYLYLLMSLTDFNQSKKFRDKIGNGLLYIMLTSLVMNLLNSLVNICVMCYNRIKYRRQRKYQGNLDNTQASSLVNDFLKDQSGNFSQISPLKAELPILQSINIHAQKVSTYIEHENITAQNEREISNQQFHKNDPHEEPHDFKLKLNPTYQDKLDWE
ncbi:hypothetical protein FGO68_gene16087 [Halteria grandinella]|uniref:TRP C-terminal domain-containing protein n=1 Tax=Halteria grandinella TaxID=5974 RepID=A0A8J8P6W5_HALGN|nr:hypothetical protein FGO68_gene16087 [Halteria grandinella]